MFQKLSRPVENTPLILFRILFGLVFLGECIGALITGWVSKTFVNAPTNFTFINFEFLLFLTDSPWAY